jgi:hypothetical protein
MNCFAAVQWIQTWIWTAIHNLQLNQVKTVQALTGSASGGQKNDTN